MSAELFNFIARHRQPLERALGECLPLSSQPGAERLNEALHYAVFPGGKRLRPMLTLLGTEIVGGDARVAMRAACAMEFLHTSSLIIDDLPAMDDADLRRSRAVLHRVFGEAIATLAALALLNQSYALLVRAARCGGSDDAASRLIFEATQCIGADGMIGGQAADLEAQTGSNGDGFLANRNLKTTALMRLTMSAGAIVSGADEAGLTALAEFGECLGAAYQIRDDLLDRLGDSRLTGKTASQDQRHLRPTLIGKLGVEGAHHLALRLIEQGKATIIAQFGDTYEARLLIEAADFIMSDIGRPGFAAKLAAGD